MGGISGIHDSSFHSPDSFLPKYFEIEKKKNLRDAGSATTLHPLNHQYKLREKGGTDSIKWVINQNWQRWPHLEQIRSDLEFVKTYFCIRQSQVVIKTPDRLDSGLLSQTRSGLSWNTLPICLSIRPSGCSYSFTSNVNLWPCHFSPSMGCFHQNNRSNTITSAFKNWDAIHIQNVLSF